MPDTFHERILDALATAVLVLDCDNRVIQMNIAAEDMLRISQKRAYEQPVVALARGFEVLGELCERVRGRQRSFGHAFTVSGLQRDGSELDILAKISPFDETNTDQLLVELFDITQKHHIDRENALVNQHGVSRRMLQQLAHEIRNPLGGLRGAAQLLERDLEDPGQREFTQIIIGEADRLEGLVAGLLGPRERPDMQQVNVHEVLEHVATIVGSESPELRCLRDYDPSLPAMLMDRDQMTQALLNLLRNASQATEGRGTLMLRTRVKTNQMLNGRVHKLVACIEIEDDGPGVPADIADTIFYPLVSGRDDGSGIGLPLAQELVNRHQGLIEFSSRPGQTIFTVNLPVNLREARA